jgi:hypothetical protein
MSSTVVKGRMTDRTGDPAEFTGEVKGGLPHGRGSYEVLGGMLKGFKYDGTFVNGKFEGFGKQALIGVEMYTGEWKEGNRNGFGDVSVSCLFLHSQRFRTPGLTVVLTGDCGRTANSMDTARCVLVLVCL